MSDWRRLCFDQWGFAVNHMGLSRRHWYPGTSQLAEMMELGEETGPIKSIDEDARSKFIELGIPIHDIPELVDDFMRFHLQTHPSSHLCLVARHRRVIGSLKIGVKADGKNYTDREIGLMAINNADTYRALCEIGYAGLERWMEVTGR